MLEYLSLLLLTLLLPLALGASVYALGWVTLCLVRLVPLIGRKYRHDRWDELNRESNI